MKYLKMILAFVVNLNAILAVLSLFFMVIRATILQSDISFKFAYYLALTTAISLLWYIFLSDKNKKDD